MSDILIFNNLPKYIQMQILSYMPYKMVTKMEQTCSHFRELIGEMEYWKNLCKSHKSYYLHSVFAPATDTTASTWKKFHKKLDTPLGVSGKRILKELKDINKDIPDGCSGGPKLDSDLHNWSCVILGPEGTPYEGGFFFLDVTFPSDYPFKPMKVELATKLLHLNVCTCKFYGHISLDILKELWTPQTTISKVLTAIRQLLREPNVANAANTDLARLYRTDRDAYDTLVRGYVKKFAM